MTSHAHGDADICDRQHGWTGLGLGCCCESSGNIPTPLRWLAETCRHVRHGLTELHDHKWDRSRIPGDVSAQHNVDFQYKFEMCAISEETKPKYYDPFFSAHALQNHYRQAACHGTPSLAAQAGW